MMMMMMMMMMILMTIMTVVYNYIITVISYFTVDRQNNGTSETKTNYNRQSNTKQSRQVVICTRCLVVYELANMQLKYV